jgi:hypothetical protein
MWRGREYLDSPLLSMWFLLFSLADRTYCVDAIIPVHREVRLTLQGVDWTQFPSYPRDCGTNLGRPLWQ